VVTPKKSPEILDHCQFTSGATLQRRRDAGRSGENGWVDYDETAPVLALVVHPDSEIALLRPMSLNVAGTIVATIEGSIEAVEIEGGSVLWMDESGKSRGLTTNLLATKIAHRLNAGLFPDDTINGRALIAGETTGPSGDLVSADVSPATLAALKRLGIEIQPG
jgi:hypothetical protein